MKKKTIVILVVAVAVAVAALGLAVHIFGGSVVATAREHLSRLGF